MRSNQKNKLNTGRKKILFLGMFLASILLIWVIYLMNISTSPVDLEIPPQIEISFDESLLQGLSKIEDNRFIRYDVKDVNKADASTKYNSTDLQNGEGIQFFHVNSRMSVSDIFGSPLDTNNFTLGNIKPDTKNKFVFAAYVPDDKLWYVYPEGPFKTRNSRGVEVVRYIQNPASFYVNPGEGFVVAAEKNFKSINLNNSKENPTDIHFDMNDLENGWNLLVIDDNETFQDALDDCRNRILATWVQDGDNSFVKASDRFNPTLKNGYKMVWLLIGPEKNRCVRYNASGGSDSCVDVEICDDDGVLYEDSCEVDDLNIIESEFYAPINGTCEIVDNYTPSNRPFICNPLGYSPVCTIGADWFENACLAYLDDSDVEFSSSLIATTTQQCLVPAIPPENLPPTCDELLFDPVCTVNSDWYMNECVLSLNEENYTISNTLLASINGDCFEPYVSQPRPNICNTLELDPVCTVDRTWYKNECLAYMAEGNNVLFSTDYVPDDVGACLIVASEIVITPNTGTITGSNVSSTLDGGVVNSGNTITSTSTSTGTSLNPGNTAINCPDIPVCTTTGELIKNECIALETGKTIDDGTLYDLVFSAQNPSGECLEIFYKTNSTTPIAGNTNSVGGIISIYDIPTPSNTGQSVNGTIIDPALIDSIEPSVIQIDANTTPFTGIEDLPGISLDNTNNTTVDNNIITIPTNNTTPILDIINKNNVFIDNNIITKFRIKSFLV